MIANIFPIVGTLSIDLNQKSIAQQINFAFTIIAASTNERDFLLHDQIIVVVHS